MKGLPYKIAGLLLIIFSLTYGLWTEVPELPIIEQSIRNLFYHVSMWFAMVAMMAASFGNAIGFLSSENMARDRRSISLAETGMFFSVMGLLTGMLWAKFTWGACGRMTLNSMVPLSPCLFTWLTLFCEIPSTIRAKERELVVCTTSSPL